LFERNHFQKVSNNKFLMLLGGKVLGQKKKQSAFMLLVRKALPFHPQYATGTNIMPI
jgi:hypothetical protein